MNQVLFLTDACGGPVTENIANAVHVAYFKMLTEFPLLDSALIANWAEEVACTMQRKRTEIHHPRSFSIMCLRRKILCHYKLKKANCVFVGGQVSLEIKTGRRAGRATSPEYGVMLRGVRVGLNERENLVLSLLLQGYKNTEIVRHLNLRRAQTMCVISQTRTKIKLLVHAKKSVA